MHYSLVDTNGSPVNGLLDADVRSWIAVGRAKPNTLAWKEGTSDWVPLGSLDEFANAFAPMEKGAASDANNPYSVPASSYSHYGQGEMSQTEVQKLIVASKPRIQGLSARECFSASFRLVTGPALWPMVGMTAIYFLVSIFAAMVPFGIGSLVIAGPMMAGSMAYSLRLVRGQPVDLSVLFSGFQLVFLASFLGYLVSSVLTFAGILLLILPGIYLAVGYTFIYGLIIDKRMQFWDALECSRKVVHANWWFVFRLVLISGLVSFLGLLAVCIGLLVAVPVIMTATAVAYQKIFSDEPIATTTTAPQPAPSVGEPY